MLELLLLVLKHCRIDPLNSNGKLSRAVVFYTMYGINTIASTKRLASLSTASSRYKSRSRRVSTQSICSWLRGRWHHVASNELLHTTASQQGNVLEVESIVRVVCATPTSMPAARFTSFESAVMVAPNTCFVVGHEVHFLRPTKTHAAKPKPIT